MKTHLATRLGAISLALLAAWPAARADEPLDITATPVGALVGGTAALTLQFDTASDLSILAATFQFSWDGTGLSFDRGNSTLLGQSWPAFVALGGTGPGETEEGNNVGSYGLSIFLTDPLVLPAGPQTLTLQFQGLHAGTFAVSTDDVTLIDDLGTVYTSAGFSTPITISAVPEPEPALMLLAGIAALGWMARRRTA